MVRAAIRWERGRGLGEWERCLCKEWGEGEAGDGAVAVRRRRGEGMEGRKERKKERGRGWDRWTVEVDWMVRWLPERSITGSKRSMTPTCVCELPVRVGRTRKHGVGMRGQSCTE